MIFCASAASANCAVLPCHLRPAGQFAMRTQWLADGRYPPCRIRDPSNREVHTNLTRHVVVRDGVAVRVVRHTEQGARERPVAIGNQAGTALPQVLIPDFLRVVHAVNLAQARSVGGSHGLNVRVAVTRPAARPPNDAGSHVVNLVAGALRPQLLDAACVPVNLLCRVELEVVVRVVVRAGFNCAEQRVLRLLAAMPSTVKPLALWKARTAA